MRLKVLKNFSYGSVSDPQRMQAGNVVESDTIDGLTPQMLHEWLRLFWVEVVM